MNKGMSTTMTLLTTGILAFGTIVSSYFAGGASGERRAHIVELALTKQIDKEVNDRSLAVKEVDGKFDVLSNKVDNQTQIIIDFKKELMEGLGIKYSLPKTSSYTNPEDDRPAVAEPKAELDAKIPLVKGINPDGSPRQ